MAVILVVDDDQFVCKSLDCLIRAMGHDTLLANDLAGALLHLSAPQHIDMLLVDIRLSTLAFGGYDIADQAIDIRPDLRVLYTSGRPLTREMTKHFVGGGRFIEKPYSPERLERSVDELLH